METGGNFEMLASAFSVVDKNLKVKNVLKTFNPFLIEKIEKNKKNLAKFVKEKNIKKFFEILTESRKAVRKVNFENFCDFSKVVPFDKSFQIENFPLIHFVLLNCKEDRSYGMIEILLNYGYSPDMKYELVAEPSKEYRNKISVGDTALHLACKKGYLHVSKLLLNNHADPNVLNDNNLNPLFYAILSENKKLVKLLLDFNCEINTAEMLKFVGNEFFYDLSKNRFGLVFDRKNPKISKSVAKISQNDFLKKILAAKDRKNFNLENLDEKFKKTKCDLIEGVPFLPAHLKDPGLVFIKEKGVSFVYKSADRTDKYLSHYKIRPGHNRPHRGKRNHPFNGFYKNCT